MKLLFSLLLSGIFCIPSIAQQTTRLPIDTTEINMLVELASENSSSIKKNRLAIDKLTKERSFVDNKLLESISLSGNLNELSIKQTFGTSDASQNLFFPRYNFGVGISIGTITSIRHTKKMFSKDIEMLQEDEQLMKVSLYKEVKLAYYNYLIFREKYSLKKSFQELATASFNTTEIRFLEGDVQLEEFNRAREDYYNFTVTLLETEEAFLIAKANLEALVGVSVDQLGLGLK